MWPFGLVGLMLVTAGASVLLARRPGRSEAEIWDIPGTARTYTTIVGTLAGFSVTSSVFIANLSVARQSANFEGVMALFLIAFVVFVSSAMEFGTTPNLTTRTSDLYRTVQGYSYLLANISFYLGLCLSWVGLPLLLSAIGLEYLAGIFIWLVLFAILGGALRISSSGLNIFTHMELLPSLALPPLAFLAALLYRLLADQFLESLLPEDHTPTLFAVICYVMAAIGFSLQSAVVGSLRSGDGSGLLQGIAGRAVIAFTGAVFTAVSLLWLAVLSEV